MKDTHELIFMFVSGALMGVLLVVCFGDFQQHKQIDRTEYIGEKSGCVTEIETKLYFIAKCSVPKQIEKDNEHCVDAIKMMGKFSNDGYFRVNDNGKIIGFRVHERDDEMIYCADIVSKEYGTHIPYPTTTKVFVGQRGTIDCDEPQNKDKCNEFIKDYNK